VYRDKKVVGVFVRFSCAATGFINERMRSFFEDATAGVEAAKRANMLIDWHWSTVYVTRNSRHRTTRF
jgi:hypothetical protein